MTEPPTYMTLTGFGALIGVVTGVTGTVLGVISAINMFDRNRVKLRVIPKIAWKQTDGNMLSTDRVPKPKQGKPNGFAVEIINLSAFPVTISEVGFGSPEPATGDRLVLNQPDLSLGYTWPPVLESRRSVTVYQGIQGLRQINLQLLKPRVYVETECGKVRYGRSAALKWFTQHFADLIAPKR